MCVWGRESVCECVCEGERDLRCLGFLGTKTSSHSVEQLFSFFCTFTPPENAAACRVCYQTFIIFFIFCIFFTFSPAEKKELLLQIQHSAGGAIYSLFCLFLLWSKSRSRGRNTYKPEIYLTCVRMKKLNQCNSLRVTAGIILSYYRAIIPPLWGIHRAVVVNQKLLPQRVQT